MWSVVKVRAHSYYFNGCMCIFIYLIVIVLWFLLKFGIIKREVHTTELVLAITNESTPMYNLKHVGNIPETPETDLQKSGQEFMAILFWFH